MFEKNLCCEVKNRLASLDYQVHFNSLRLFFSFLKVDKTRQKEFELELQHFLFDQRHLRVEMKTC